MAGKHYKIVAVAAVLVTLGTCAAMHTAKAATFSSPARSSPSFSPSRGYTAPARPATPMQPAKPQAPAKPQEPYRGSNSNSSSGRSFPSTWFPWFVGGSSSNNDDDEEKAKREKRK